MVCINNEEKVICQVVLLFFKSVWLRNLFMKQHWLSLLFKVFTLIELNAMIFYQNTDDGQNPLWSNMLYGKFLICWIIYLFLVCHYSLLSNSLPHLWQKNKLNIPWPVSHKSCDALNCYSNGYSLKGHDLSNSTLVPNKIHERLA